MKLGAGHPMGPFELADYVGKKYTDKEREESELRVSSTVRLQGGNRAEGNVATRVTVCHLLSPI